MHFIIHELLGIPEICTKNAYFKQLHQSTNYLQKYLLDCLSYYSWKFFQQSLQAALHFRSRKWVMPTFQMMRYKFSVSLTGLLQCYSVEEHQKSPRWKSDLMSMASCHTCFWLGKEPTFEPKLTSAVAFVRFFGPLSRAYRLYLLLTKLLIWVSLYGQTKIGRYTHTLFIVNWMHAWFKNIFKPRGFQCGIKMFYNGLHCQLLL